MYRLCSPQDTGSAKRIRFRLPWLTRLTRGSQSCTRAYGKTPAVFHRRERLTWERCKNFLQALVTHGTPV